MFVSAQYGIRFALRYYAPPPNRFFQFPRFVRVIAPEPQPRRRFRRKTDRKTGRFSSRERNPHTKRANIRIISQNTKPKPLVLTFQARFSEKRFIGPANSAEKQDISSQHPCRSDCCSIPRPALERPLPQGTSAPGTSKPPTRCPTGPQPPDFRPATPRSADITAPPRYTDNVSFLRC